MLRNLELKLDRAKLDRALQGKIRINMYSANLYCFALFRWMIGDWSPCSSCPRGARYRMVKCIKQSGIKEGEVVFVAESECAGSKPTSRGRCNCPESK